MNKRSLCRRFLSVAAVGAATAVVIFLAGCGDKKEPVGPPSTYTYTLTLKSDPQNTGNFTPESREFEPGDVVIVTVSPKTPKYKFIGWDDAANTKDSVITITMDGDKGLTAKFETLYAITVVADPDSGGKVTLTPNAAYYSAGANVIVRANANPGYAFVNGWAHDSTVAVNFFQYKVVESDTTFTARFERRYTFTFTPQEPSGGVCDDCGTVALNPAKEYYVKGDVIVATANGKDGYMFMGWKDQTGNLKEDGFEYKITVGVNSETLLTPIFMANQ